MKTTEPQTKYTPCPISSLAHFKAKNALLTAQRDELLDALKYAASAFRNIAVNRYAIEAGNLPESKAIRADNIVDAEIAVLAAINKAEGRE